MYRVVFIEFWKFILIKRFAVLLSLLVLFAGSANADDSTKQPIEGPRSSNIAATQKHELPKRVALVIGNSAYKHTSQLKNPINDANAISATLAGLNFQVIKGIDLNRKGLESKIREFSKKLSNAQVGLFFYAGHGLQVDGTNYLVPIDAKVETEDDLDFELVAFRKLLARMERKASTNLIFLDACRDNPLARNLARNMGTRSTAIGRGLAKVETGLGTLVAFATQPGNVALDGKGLNSPFTESILKHIGTPDLDIALMMRRARREVLKATNGSQVPWTNSSLTDSFYFLPSLNTPKSEQAQDTKPSHFQEISTAYRAAQQVGTCQSYTAFEEAYPKSMFAKISKEWRKTNCEPSDAQSLARGLQVELKRVGCYPGAIDGVWGKSSRSALMQFAKRSKVQVSSNKLTQEIYKVIKSHQSIICPQNTKPIRKTSTQPQANKSPSKRSIKSKPRKSGRTCHLGDIEGCRRGCRLGYQRACDALRRLGG